MIIGTDSFQQRKQDSGSLRWDFVEKLGLDIGSLALVWKLPARNEKVIANTS